MYVTSVPSSASKKAPPSIANCSEIRPHAMESTRSPANRAKAACAGAIDESARSCAASLMRSITCTFPGATFVVSNGPSPGGTHARMELIRRTSMAAQARVARLNPLVASELRRVVQRGRRQLSRCIHCGAHQCGLSLAGEPGQRRHKTVQFAGASGQAAAECFNHRRAA